MNFTLRISTACSFFGERVYRRIVGKLGHTGEWKVRDAFDIFSLSTCFRSLLQIASVRMVLQKPKFAVGLSLQRHYCPYAVFEDFLPSCSHRASPQLPNPVGISCTCCLKYFYNCTALFVCGGSGGNGFILNISPSYIWVKEQGWGYPFKCW